MDEKEEAERVKQWADLAWKQIQAHHEAMRLCRTEQKLWPDHPTSEQIERWKRIAVAAEALLFSADHYGSVNYTRLREALKP